MRPALLALLLILLAPGHALAERAPSDEEQRLYKAYGDALYQVQVINNASGKKTSIGSGFQITADGLIATNYHVVSAALRRPDENHVEFLHGAEGHGPLRVLIADVVNDLAIVKPEKPGRAHLALGASALPKGTHLFSLGNPHDIGFTIIEGTFSGAVEDSFVEKIHFSGAINPGMSGGPVIGHDGAVVGINDATAGNQIGFLVPVEALKKLLAGARALPSDDDFTKHAAARIESQLRAAQDRNIKAMLADSSWGAMSFGGFSVPERALPVFKCWGGGENPEKNAYERYAAECATQDSIFVDENFRTGRIGYQYRYLTAKEALNQTRFYSFYSDMFEQANGGHENAAEDDVTNFSCNSGFVDLAGGRWLSHFCARRYKKYPSLHDVQLYMAQVGAGKKGFIVSLAAQGVSKESSLALVRRFMREIKAKP